ncbi:hypothetical protein AB0C13_32025, partial [Streptomyces sp. NPDC049099]|uniref:hypothetical protein n=1 Tax=Streptomyces sp. NPDC049099 TaxID=3155768 RepID=UPI00343A66E6
MQIPPSTWRCCPARFEGSQDGQSIPSDRWADDCKGATLSEESAEHIRRRTHDARRLLEQDASTRHALLAETLVEHGPALVDTLHLMAELARRGEVSLAAEPLDALIDEAEGLLIRWYAGEQLTARADEAERRARSLDAWGSTSHDD